MRTLLIALVVMSTLATWPAAANLTGAWTLELDPDFSGNQSAVDCRFQQDGRKLTADCGNGPTISGEVDEHKVTLLVKTGMKNFYRLTVQRLKLVP